VEGRWAAETEKEKNKNKDEDKEIMLRNEDETSWCQSVTTKELGEVRRMGRCHIEARDTV
jgi:hypothetical protein